MKTVSLDHAYDFYPLYQLTYGRQVDVKAFEALNASVAADNFWSSNLRTTKTGLGPALRILELFAGVSEHKALFESISRLPIQKYDALDINHTIKSPHVMIGDALTADYPGYNFIMAHYYSLATCTDSRAALQALFNNVHRNLTSAKKRKKGSAAFYFHLGHDGYTNALLNVGVPVKNFELFVPYGHDLRKAFNLDRYDDCTLTYDTLREYNRVTSLNTDWVKNIKLRIKGVPVVEFKIAQPFVSRFWSEPEVVDIAKEAGFTGFHFYHFGTDSRGDVAEASRFQLHAVVKHPNTPDDDGTYDDGETLDAFKATHMMVTV